MSKKILIVEDDPDVSRFLEQLLKDEGFTVLTARDGKEGYDVLKKEKPDLITLDLQMSHDSGTDFYRRMQHNKELSHIPVIVISGLAGRHLAVSKPAAVFDKPIDKHELLKTIDKILE